MDGKTITIAPRTGTASRQKLANALMSQGMSTAPVGHWTQALARVAQAYAGKSMGEDITETEQARKTAARDTLTEALSAYRGDVEAPIMTEAAGPVQPGQMPPMMATGETQMIPGQGQDRAALMQALMQNPDLAEQVQGGELSRILAGGGDFKVPSGYMKAPSGGVQPIPGWVNASRYKPLSYEDEQGRLINALIDVGQIQPGQGPDGLRAGPGGIIELGTKKQKTLPAETAGKVGLLQQGLKDIKEANQLLFKPDGSFDRVNAANAWLNTPYTEGRDIRGRYKTALSGKIYVTTGAVASPEELSDNMDSFMPGPFDNANTAQDKAVRLNEFLNTTLMRMDESGRLVPQDTDLAAWMKNSLRIAKEYKAKPSGTFEKPATPQTEEDYNAIKSGEYFIDPEDGKRYRK